MKTIRFLLATPVICFFALASLALQSLAQTTGPALTAYYGVKDALVAADAAKAKTKATELVSALDKVSTASLSDTDKKSLVSAKTKAASISQLDNVDAQRKQFEALSTGMLALTRATKPTKAYVLFCPMKNASWLSDKKEVKNPYFGNKMLTCGSVKEEI